MELRELANALGVENYPAALEEIYKNLPMDDGLICNVDHITALNEKYELFKEYTDLVLRGARELRENENLYTWARLAYAYCKDVSRYESSKMPIPKSDGSAAGDMFAALVLTRQIPDAVELYEKRGFTEAQIKKNLENIRINLWVHEITQGKPSLSQGLFSWLCLYMKALILDHKGFNYQPASWEYDSILLKNKVSGEYVFIMVRGRFSKDGLVLGSVGATDEEGAFDAEFMEQPDLFFAHRVKDARVQPTLEKFLKSEWCAVLRPGDDVIGLHIPRHTNLDPDFVSESFKEGFELTKKLFPEFSPKCIRCYSWLMEPKLVDILGPEAKLSKFTLRFTKHPLRDTSGAGCLGYVWPGEKCPTEEYSEKTTLQRGIKKLLLEGDFIRSTAGVIVDTL